MKKLLKTTLSFMLAFVMVLSVGALVSAETKISVTLDGTVLTFADQDPVIVDDRTLVPFRGILEAMGVTVSWDGPTRTVTAVRDDVTVTLTIDEAMLYKNGEAIALDVPAKIINDRTMVPARAVSESFDAKVGWDAGERNVVISTDEVLHKAFEVAAGAKEIVWSAAAEFTYAGMPVSVTMTTGMDYENQLELSAYTIDMSMGSTYGTTVTGQEKTYVEADGAVTEQGTAADWSVMPFIDENSAFLFVSEEENERIYEAVLLSTDNVGMKLAIDKETAELTRIIIPKDELEAFFGLEGAVFTEDVVGEFAFDTGEVLKAWNKYNAEPVSAE